MSEPVRDFPASPPSSNDVYSVLTVSKKKITGIEVDVKSSSYCLFLSEYVQKSERQSSNILHKIPFSTTRSTFSP